MTTEPTNGEQEPPYIVTISMDRKTLRVTCEGNVEDLDVVMMMLSTALRHFDIEQRVVTGIGAQEKVRRQRESEEIARRIAAAGIKQ